MSAAAETRIFVSHAGRDRAWAEWVRWHLESAGYATELDSVDWPAGTNYVEAAHKALARSNPMLVLLSAAYLDVDRFTTDQWAARLAQRRKSPTAKLIPLRIDKVDLQDGLWAPISVPDVCDLAPDQAVSVLLDAVRQVIDPPATSGGLTPPPYPGAPVVDAGPRPPGSLPRVWNLPRRNPAFTGRDGMLNRLHDTLCANSRAALQALHGMGGVGKTHLALEYGHRFAGEYDLAWWIPAEQPELIGDHLAALAAAAGLVPAGTATPAAVDTLRAHLRAGGRWLLVFDNAEDRDDLSPWLPDGPGHLIITSRNPTWTGVAQPVDVDVFTRSESVALLHIHLPHLPAKEAGRLADALGNLPLAIGQAADLLAETRIGIDAYLTELKERAGELLRCRRPPAGYPKPLAATVTLAANRLAVDDPAAGQLLALCAYLGPEPIPADLFTGRPDLLPQPLAEVARRPVAFARTAAQLSRYGLARITGTGPLLHRLTQAVLRDADPDAVNHRGIVEALLVDAQPDDPSTPAWWPCWSRLLPHILACEPATTDNRRLRWAAVAGLWHLLARGDARVALPLVEHLHTTWTGRHGPDDETTIAAAHVLANTHRQLGDYRRARHLDEDILTRVRRLHGTNQPAVIRATTSLADGLHTLGEYGLARRLDAAILTHRRQTLGEDHQLTLSSANNLADDLRELGEYERARELDVDTLARRRRVLKEDHPHILTSANNLANDLRKLGEYELAREMDEDTLARRRRVLGDEHPETLLSASNLAADLRDLGEYERARELDVDTLACRRRVLGEDHPDTLSSASNLAADLRDLGEHERARELDLDTLARRRRVLGDGHPDTVESADNLAACKDARISG